MINDENESRRDWILYRFEYHAKFNNRIKDYKVWQDGYHAIECNTIQMIEQKLNYIHQNPVTAQVVNEAEHYIYSSAIDYAGDKGLLDIILLNVHFS